jgi:hypothetical protein
MFDFVGISSTVRFIFSSPTFLKAVDWHRFLSPVGVFILQCSDLDDSYRSLFQRFCLWASRIRAYSAPKDDVDQLEQEGFQVLAEMQMKLPVFWSTINSHLVGHIAAVIRRVGPSFSQSMYVALM